MQYSDVLAKHERLLSYVIFRISFHRLWMQMKVDYM